MNFSPDPIGKLPNVGKTIFATMGQLARDHNALSLAQGFPDFNCAEKLIELVNKYMKEGCNQYSPMEGIFSLRENICHKTEQLYGFGYNPLTEVTITAGATEAVYATISAVIQPGDEAIILQPAFDSYSPVVELNGGKPVFIELTYPDYKIDWEQIKNSISKKTKLLIINSPHNPTGSVITKEDIRELIDIIRNTSVYLLSDEVYEHIIFDGLKHESFILYPELRERSFILSSFGKTFHSTGWRLGYCLAPEKLSEAFRKIHQFLTFSAPTPMQYAIADYLAEKEHYLGLPDFYQKKRDKFAGLLQSSRFSLSPSKGTYFQLCSYKEISQEKDTDFAVRLVKEYGIASIPVSVFYHSKRDDKIIRFCFAKEDSTLEKAAEILCRI